MAYRSQMYSLVEPDQFKQGFSVDAFLVSLTKDVLNSKPSSGSGGAGVASSAKASVDRVQKLLSVLDRADDEVSQLNYDVTAKLTELQVTVNHDEAEYKAEVRALERGLDRIKDCIRDIDYRVSRVSQTATRIGDRLQTAESMRVRSLEALELITYLQSFSTLINDDYAALPQLFTDERTLAEAAAVSRRLATLAAEVQSAKQRTKLVTREGLDQPQPTPGNTGGVGSIEHTCKVLETYCNWLENRVVSRFDQAVAEANAPVLAECVRIMSEFDRQKTIAQRWVASRPMFLDIEDDLFESALQQEQQQLTRADSNGGHAQQDLNSINNAQINALASLYKSLHAAVKEEVALVKQIFPSPDMVLNLLLQRLFEQRVQAALERLLELGNTPVKAARGGQSAAARQQARLKLLAECYDKTMLLSSNLERAVRGFTVDVAAMSDGLFPTFLGGYPAQELQWLETAFQEESFKVESPELSLMHSQMIIGWNNEAVSRCQRLSAPGQAPCNVRLLFHHVVVSGHSGHAHPGCLLEQLARQIISGVEYSLELCNASTSATATSNIFKLGFGSVNRASSNQMAEAFINDKIRKVLEAAHVACHIIAAVQSHFRKVIVPAVAPSVSDHSAATSALVALIKAVEESVMVTLRKCVDAFMVQIERVLYNEQRQRDFTPRDDALSFDKPTGACMMATAMLHALGAAANDTLESSNLQSFAAEVGRRFYSVLVSHMTRFMYSPTGALKWKKDVSEYADILKGYGVAAVNEEMAHLQQVHSHSAQFVWVVISLCYCPVVCACFVAHTQTHFACPVPSVDLPCLTSYNLYIVQVVNVLIVAPESLLGLVNGTLRMAHRDALRFISLREDFKSAKVDNKTLAQLFAGEGMEGQIQLGGNQQGRK
eukprot:jgi/Chrzof1/12789/Cz07g07190.t1